MHARACVLGPFLRAGCAGAAWVHGGSLGSGMSAGGLCLATLVGCVRWSGPPCRGAGAWRRCAGGRVGGWATRCPPAVRGWAYVDAWAGAAAGGSFRTVAPVTVWGMTLPLHGGRVLCGKVPNHAYSQGSQELSASAGACSPGSLADAQRSAVACPLRTPPCAPASYVPCIARKVALVVKN